MAKFCKERGLNVWAYTGFTFEQLLEKSKEDENLKELMNNIDVLVDGKFILEQKSLNIFFRGSKNQRILNLKKSLKKQAAVEVRKYKQKENPKNAGYSRYKKDKNMFI